jgi:hypothetical protein
VATIKAAYIDLPVFCCPSQLLKMLKGEVTVAFNAGVLLHGALIRSLYRGP